MGVFALSLIFVSALVFIGVFLLFKKFKSRSTPFKNPFYWVTAVIVTPVVYIGVISIWFLYTSSYEAKSFDKVDWSENRETRYEYVDDLVDNNKLIGLTKNELGEMLGEFDYEDDSLLIFYIGYSPKYFLNMDPDWLEIDLTDGKVSNVRIKQ
jgi:amino acid transporter